jgi:hypothetical protein
MKDSTNKIKILKILLESPKTTGEIAIELGYLDKKGHGKYNIINSDLKTLTQYGFIHRFAEKKKRPGAPATTYDIVYELSVLRELLKKYPLLISDLQKSDKIRALIGREFYKDLPRIKEYEDEVNFFSRLLIGSPTFFKLVLSTPENVLSERFISIYAHTPDGIYRGIVEQSIEKSREEMGFKKTMKFFPEDHLTIEDRKNIKLMQEFHDAIFETCVYSDILNGIFNPSAVDYIHKKNEHQVRHREKWIESVKKAMYELGQKNPHSPYIQFDDTFGAAEDWQKE